MEEYIIDPVLWNLGVISQKLENQSLKAFVRSA